jgi:hypothetical protein
MNQPNLKYDHIFAVLRHDSYVSNPIDAITVLRVFVSESEAIAESKRLNNLQQDSRIGEINSCYFVRQGRISKGLLKKQK